MADGAKKVSALSADQLRRLMDRLKQSAGSADRIGRAPRDGGPLPLSFSQESLWFLDRLGAGSAAYNIPAAVRLRGPLDAAALRRTFEEVVSRHETLRARFGERDGAPFQTIAPEAGFELPGIDLSGLPEDRREDEALHWATGSARLPFDLSRGPLLRAFLFRLGGSEHVLALTLHHIVADGWSIGVLIREVAALYPAFAAGKPSPLSELPLQYADYAVWQRGHLQGETLEREVAFWRERLAGTPPLDLVPDRLRPAAPGFEGARRELALSREETAGLHALARREGTTPFMTLLALFEILLLRWTGQTDFAVGSPVANRDRGEVQGLIGFFVNTLVLRVDLSGGPTVAEALRRVREVAVSAYAHAELPFEKLVEELRPEREAGRNPLFQVLFALQDEPWPATRIGDLELALTDLDTGTAKVDLTLLWREQEGRLTGWLESATDLFEAATAERLLRGQRALLRAAAASPDASVQELPLLDAAERRQILVDWNRTAAEYPQEVPVHRLFLAQAESEPERVAIEDGDLALTYAELRERAGELAARLRGLGVGPESRVGFCLERSADLGVAMLGILAAGGAYVPLDPGYPEERLAFMVEDAAVTSVVTEDRLLPRLPPGLPERGVAVLSIRERSPGRALKQWAEVSGDGLALVLYTSGSTGRPKGVGLPHRGVARLVLGTGYIDFAPDERIAQVSNSSFDAATFEIWGALLHGACLVGVERDVLLSPRRFARFLRERRITTLLLTTALFQQIVHEVPDAFATVRHLLFGGETADPRRVREALAAPPGRLVHAYGPAESTTLTTCQTVTAVRGDAPNVPIGRPIANTRVYVVDGSLQPVPVGVAGELLVGGDGLARGYLGRPELTAERFVPSPFAGEGEAPGARLYRSGDRVRWRDGGGLEFLGRADTQVKIRGFRIEPGEIEAALTGHPAVREAAVLAVEDGGERRLVAWVAAGLPEGELREFLARRLPAYMVPARFVFLDALPLTPNGKVDRRALPRPAAAVGTAGGDRPGTAAEEILAGLVASLLGLPSVGIHDDFFALGGHSLLAIRLVARVRELLGVEIELRSVFETPTVAELARRLGTADATPPIARRGETADPPPLSFAQERLWFLDRLEPGSPLYNVPAVVRLEGNLQTEALRQALETVAARHEAMRTAFRETSGRPVQIVAPALAVALPVVDLAGLPGEARASEALRLATDETLRPFDLEAGPLFRALLVRSGGDEHRLLLTLHHIISDGWSMGVLVREAQALYRAAVSGERADLPALPVQYADYAVWQRSWLAGEALAARLAWWRERLAGAPPELDLPLDRPRPAVADRRGAGCSRELPRSLWAKVEALARQAGATPFLVVLTALEALLARYSGADDLTVGTPVAGRTRREVEDLIGLFVNTLVLRAGLAGDPSFEGALARAREAMLGAHAHQDLPFERLVEELAPERETGRTPLFQVMLAFGDLPRPPLELPGLRLSVLESAARTSKFDLTVSCTPREDGAALHLVYRTDLFERATAERMADHLALLLEDAVERPAARLSELRLLTPAEREQLAREAAETRRSAPEAAQTVPELFREVAARMPEAVAVAGSGGPLTFRELAARSARLAARLSSLGAGPEVPVALCAEPSAGLVAGLLAILAAGGVWVPLDPAHPDDRLAGMLEDSGAPLLLVEERFAGRFAGARARLVLLDGAEAAPPEIPARPAVSPEGAAYVIYTSGSTGRPKGTVICHRSLAGYLAWFNERFAAAGALPLPAISSPGFDASLKQLLAPLLRGDAVRIVPPGTAARPDDLLAELARHEAVAVNGVPSLWRALLDRIEADPAAGQSLRHLLLGGEALDADLLARTLRALPGIEIWNLYGPTEATANASCARVTRGEMGIGRAVAGAALHVVDAHLHLLPVGVPGELAIAGPGLARGYLGLPALTAERFVPNPFAEEPGERLYRTGDRARLRPGMEVELLGRLDRQVKVRGFRVELGEVEAVLASHPQVREAAVTALPHGSFETRLVAYLGADSSLPPEEVRRFAAERLPAPMVPTAWVRLDRLPRTPAGKLDARALPAPSPQAGGERGPDTLRTPAEELVAAVFADLLGVEPVGPGDGFFALGGHSLLATQALSRLRSAFGVELPLRALFDRPRVAELAEALEEARRGGPGRAAPPLVPVARGGDLPLSFAQERLWFLDQLEPGNTAYNVPAAFTLSGALDVPALAAAYGEIARRHEALRTTFAAVDGRPVQRISPPGALPIPVVDLAGLAAADRQAEAERLAAEEARRAFDLARGPLARLTLLRLGEGEHRAVLVQHHIVSDAWSTRVLVRELTALYSALVLGTGPALPELPVQSADYAAWQRAWLQGGVLEAELAFWREALAGAPGVLELPADRPRPPVPSGRGGSQTASLPPDLASALAGLGRREGLTPFMTLFAAWSALLFRLSEQTDFVVGVPIANRNRLETEGLIGFFTNTLALRSRPRAEASFLGLARAVRETALAAYSHQDLPFERLVEELAPERSLAHTPLFQVLFSFQDLPAGELTLPGLTLAPARLAQRTAKFDLSLFLAPADGGLSATLEFSADLFEAATAERLLARFRTLLEGAAADPGRSLAELPLLPASERHQLLSEWNEAPAGESPPVHLLVAAQARRTPEAIAVLAADGTELSYGDLDRLSERLAHRLRELGVRPDDRVGVCLERGWEGVVALLAILRAGGCYLPLDPAYPRERLGFMLADAAAPVIVTRDRLAQALPPHGATVLPLDRGWPEAAAAGELPEAGPDHLAYAIYTSGSTGRPKGVALPHRTLANLIAWQIRASSVPAGRTLQLASPSFDVSLQETLATWAAGGTLVLLAEEARGDAEALLRRLAEARVERLFLPFVALQQLAEAAASSPFALPPLREVVTAGEQLQVTPEVRALFARLPGCRLCNQYGPSEAHVVTELSLENERPGAVEEWPALPAIGRPIAATSVHLLDPRGELVPVGVPGEICLGGAGLARGYLGRPDQTAGRFVPDPWGQGERLYRTGDLGRRLASGDVEFLGRIDHQVKIRGFRIELGEIEAALAAHPAVREAVVVARGEGAARRLVAYVLPAAAGDLPVERLRAHLGESLPDYMVPAAFVPVAALPLTPSGKVDRKALAAGGPEPREAAAPDDAPRTPTEELLAGLWAEVLGLERVGIHEGFFDLGGHSLLATRLVARLRGAFGVELPLRALFEKPSVAELAGLLDSLTRESRGLAAPPLTRLPGSAEPPLSFAQQSLWMLHRIEGASTTYNMAASVELRGRLDVAALAGSFADVVARHAALRTSFALRDGEPRQVVHPHLEVPLLLADLSALPADRWEEAREAVHRQIRGPFDLAEAPLLRTALLRRDPELHVLELCQHHIVSDAWSIGILVRELAAGYAARAEGGRPALPPLPVQYADYAAWQRSWLRGEALERLLAFWHRQLGTDPPAARPPAPRPAPAVRTRRGGRRIFPLPEGLEPALKALARREGVTLFMLLLAAFQALLHRSTGQEDLVVVAAASRRDRLETEGLIGCFLNMLPLRVPLTGDLPFRRLLHRVREASLDAFAHQELPFERLVTELRLKSDRGRSPFQVAFGVQSAPPPLPELPGLAIRLLDSDSGNARLDLTLWVTESPEGLTAAWTYSADLFDGEDMERLHGLYAALLAAAAADPDARLRDLAPAAAPERAAGAVPRRPWEDLKKRKLHETRRRAVRGST